MALGEEMDKHKNMLLSDIGLLCMLALFSLVYIFLLTDIKLYTSEVTTKIFIISLFVGAYSYIMSKDNIFDFLIFLVITLLIFYLFYSAIYTNSIISFYILLLGIIIISAIIMLFNESILSMFIIIFIEVVIIFSIGEFFEYQLLIELNNNVKKYILIDIRYFVSLIILLIFSLRAIFLAIKEGNPNVSDYIRLKKQYYNESSNKNILSEFIKPFKIIVKILINFILTLINFILLFFHKIIIYLYRIGKYLFIELAKGLFDEGVFFIIRILIPYVFMIIFYLYLIDVIYNDIITYVIGSFSIQYIDDFFWLLLKILLFFIASVVILNLHIFILDFSIEDVQYEMSAFLATIYILIFYAISLILYFLVFAFNINIIGFNEFGLFSLIITIIIIGFFIKEIFSS